MNDEIFIALGSNMGDRKGNILNAVAAVSRLPGTLITALAPFYDTEPVGYMSQSNFLNTVMRLSCSLQPEEILRELLQIETSTFDRKRDLRWGPRCIDLDLLFYGDKIIDNPPELLLPHPRLHERRFVLAPLADIAPGFVHPVCGKSIRELLDGLKNGGKVTRFKGC